MGDESECILHAKMVDCERARTEWREAKRLWTTAWDEGVSFYKFLFSDEYSADSLAEQLRSRPTLWTVIDMEETTEVRTRNTMREHIENLQRRDVTLHQERVSIAQERASIEQERASIEAKKLTQLKKTLIQQQKFIQQENENMRLRARSRRQGDVTVGPQDACETASGLEYFQASHRIGISLSTINDTRNIGLVDENRHERNDIKLAPVYKELVDAWSVFGSTEDFETKLVNLVPQLCEDNVRNAFGCSELTFDVTASGGYSMSKMTYLHYFYNLFPPLFMAAAGGCDSTLYKADQMISSSLSVQFLSREEGNNFEASKLCTKPDIAVTLSDGFDVYGMLEMKPSRSMYDEPDFIDSNKCVLLTAVTAIAVRNSIEKEHYGEVAIPFIFATGSTCSLYVTTLDEDGNPCVQYVKYPGTQDYAINQNFCKSPSDTRRKMLVALAVLLNKFKTFFEEKGRTNYERNFAMTKLTVRNLPTFYFTNQGTGSDRHSSSGEIESKRGSQALSYRSMESSAKEAAACGGKFCNVKFPFLRSVHITDSGVVRYEQTTSPFYFEGYPVSSAIQVPTNKVFLKLWNVQDIDACSVESEWTYHRTAFEAGVPVAAPVLPEITKSRSSCGSEFLVFAVEYVDQDHIESTHAFVHFCEALIDTVMKLHDKAALLHCDLKPDNIRWSKGVVRLIDFGHAQNLMNAKWVRSTKGYEAPEILNEMPCSTETDAYSVGRIILTMLEELENIWRHEPVQENSICGLLRVIGENLAHDDPHSRLTLIEASKKLRSYYEDNHQ